MLPQKPCDFCDFQTAGRCLTESSKLASCAHLAKYMLLANQHLRAGRWDSSGQSRGMTCLKGRTSNQ